jgi:hypothetical protein
MIITILSDKMVEVNITKAEFKEIMANEDEFNMTSSVTIPFKAEAVLDKRIKAPDMSLILEELEGFKYQPTYESAVRVGGELDSKGNPKPTAKIEITRTGLKEEEIYETVAADVLRGIDETVTAISGVKDALQQ